MGKKSQSRPPSRAVKLGLSAVLAVGLMPWGGVAVAAEGEGGLADAVASSFASVSGFYGWTSTHYSFDENWFLAISAPPYRFPCSTAWLLNSSPLFTAKLRFARANAVAPGRRCSFCHFFVCKNTDPPQSTGLRGTSFLENRRIEPSRRRQI